MRWAAIWNFTLVNIGVLLCGMAYTVPSAIFPNQVGLVEGLTYVSSVGVLLCGMAYTVPSALFPNQVGGLTYIKSGRISRDCNNPEKNYATKIRNIIFSILH